MIGSNSIRPGLPGPAAVLFNRQITGILLTVIKSPLFDDYDKTPIHYMRIKNSDTIKEHRPIPSGSTVSI